MVLKVSWLNISWRGSMAKRREKVLAPPRVVASSSEGGTGSTQKNGFGQMP
jgi:hypothetical protein